MTVYLAYADGNVVGAFMHQEDAQDRVDGLFARHRANDISVDAVHVE